MKRFFRPALAALLLPSLHGAVHAQNMPSTVPEPAVEHIRIEDDRARIDELRVRGQTQRITVQPKKGGKAYEVLPADGSRDLSSDATRGAAGQRVWHLFSF